MNKDHNIKARKSENLYVAQVLEASLLCTLTRADVIGPGIIDLNFKVNVEGPDASGIVDALAKSVSQSVNFNGKACLERDTCGLCQKLIKDVLSFSVVCGGSGEGTCSDCVPVRRSSRKRSKKTFTEGHHVSVDKELDHASDRGGPSQKKRVKKSSNYKASSTDHAKHPAETIGDVSGRDDTVSQVKPNTKVLAKGLVCEICEDSFSDDAVFVDHLFKHSDLHLLKCAVCKGSFSSKYVLKKHLMRHVPEENRPYRCEICQKGFTEGFYYREHVKTHDEAKPYKCSQCPKRYTSGTALRRHFQEHVPGKGKGKDKKSKLSRESVADIVAVDGKDGDTHVLLDELEDEQDLKGDTWENIGSNTELSDSCESDSETKNTESFETVDNVKMPKCDVVIQSKPALNDSVTNPKSSQNVVFKCKLCSKDFATESCLKEHQSVHSSDRPYPCDVCDKSFFNRQVMERHASKHIPPEKWEHKCGVCGKKFSHISYLHDHKWIHADEKPYKCDQCDKCYVSSQSLCKHAISHNTGVHKCSTCNRRFPTTHGLAEHTYTHTGILPFCCQVCGKKFKLHQAFSKHGQVHLTVKPLSCGDCEKTFYTKSDLDIHVRIHSGYRPFQCDVCGKTYTRKGILQSHVLTHSEDYYVLKPCSVCGKELKGNRALHQHLQTHQEEKRFVCEQCGKRFPSTKSLWSHKQTHKGHKPHACKHCSKMFRSITHCRNHMKTHTGENLVQCLLCKDWFTDTKYVEKVHPRFCKARQVFCNVCGRGLCHNQALQSHIGLHTGTRPHGCDTCGRAFTKERFLQEHIKRHLESKSHLCRTCGKGFNRPSDLKKHESRHNSNRQMSEMRSLLSDKLKPVWEQQVSALETPSASVNMSDVLAGGNIITISGPDTIIEEVHNMSDVGHVSDEHVVLATIDINQIGPGHSSQYVTHPEYGLVQQTSVIQYHDSMQPVVQQQEIQQQQQQQQQFPQHEYFLAPDQQHYDLQG